jgi:hypothetical protein
MADEPQAAPASNDDVSGKGQSSNGPKPKFGQILDIGGQYWTVQSSEKGEVTVSRRVGETTNERTLSAKEYDAAAARPVPQNLRSIKPPRNISVGSFIDQRGIVGRVLGYDATTGDIEIESPDANTTWVSGKDLLGVTAPPTNETSESPGEKKQGNTIDRWVRGQVSTLVHGEGPSPAARKQKAVSSTKREARERVKKKKAEPEEEGLAPRITAKVEKHDSDKDDYLIALRDEATGEVEYRWVDGSFARANLKRVIGETGEGQSVRETLLKNEELKDISDHLNLRKVTREDIERSNVKKTSARAAEVTKTDAESVEKITSAATSKKKTGASTKTSVVVSKTVPVGGAVGAPSVRVSKTVQVGKPATKDTRSVRVSKTVKVDEEPKQPSIRETRTELRAQVGKARSTPSETGIKATLAVPVAPATRGVAVLGVAKAVIDVLPAEPSADAARAAQQQALYAKAMHAMEVVSSRAVDKRKSIQDLQSQVGALRQEVAGLNAQASAPADGGAYRTPDISSRIQQVSSQLGNTQNKLAMARYGLQTDEAQAQQLRISTNLMRNAAPEVRSGRVPRSVIGLVTQSIPQDVPPPSPARATALIATLEQGAVAPSPKMPATPETRIRETKTQPPTPRVEPQVVTDRTRAQISRGGLSLPQSTAVALSAAKQSDRRRSEYQEGLGTPDAREAAFATAGAQPNPVIETIPQSYTQAEEPEGDDVYLPGGEGESSEFMRKQRKGIATREQLLPATTGGLEPTTFTPEVERNQHVRTEQGGPDEEAIRAAKYQADLERTKAAAFQTFDVEKTESEETSVKHKQGAFKQAEAVRRNVSRLVDLIDTAHGLEDIIGLVAVLMNMNMRVLTMGFSKKSITRKFFPPAQFPFEAAGILTMDIIIFSIFFVSFCAMIAPFVLLASGSLGVIAAVAS